jgi:RsiW-degrading membrane proteinase PrsW (M82 family)
VTQEPTPATDPAIDAPGAPRPLTDQPSATSSPVVAPAGLPLQSFALLLALAGGAFGIVAALFQELHAFNPLLPFVGAPLIEEALKPAGIYVILLRWPHVLRGYLHTAVLAALAGLVFALIESLIYVTVYVSDPSDTYIRIRFTLPVALHMTASFLVGLGLDRRVIDWCAGRAAFPRRARNFYIAGVAVHAIYNTTVVILSLTGVLDIE